MMTMLKDEEIKAGQVWSRADGTKATVVIVEVQNGMITYTYGTQGHHHQKYSKDSFCFQCRYYLKEVPNGPVSTT